MITSGMMCCGTLKLSVFGVPEQLVDLLRQSYANSQAHVKVAGGCTSDSYHRQVGLLQGCPVSPVLYNLYIAQELKALRAADVGGVKLSTLIKLHLIVYADDVILLAQDYHALQQMFDMLQSSFASIGLQFQTRIKQLGSTWRDPLQEGMEYPTLLKA